MMTTAVLGLTARMLVVSMKLLLFAGYGLVRLGVACWRLPGRLRSARRLLSATLPCPSCGMENATAGRYACGACSAEWLGDVRSPCPICGARAAYIPCTACGSAIVLGGMP